MSISLPVVMLTLTEHRRHRVAWTPRAAEMLYALGGRSPYCGGLDDVDAVLAPCGAVWV